MLLEERVQQIQANIATACLRSQRVKSSVTLLAVSKTVGEVEVAQAMAAGLKDFGENKAQELCRKAPAFPQVRWHFIGNLQSNKVKDVLPYVCCIHSLDRISLAEEIQKRAGIRRISCLLEVNVAQEKSKAGLYLDEVLPFLKSLENYPAIVVHGLMTIAPMNPDSQSSRPVFRALRQKFEEIRDYQLPYAPVDTLSMGMTGDYMVAIEEGATLVRIGTGIFGPRIYTK